MTAPTTATSVPTYLAEKDWQAIVVAFAGWHGWRHFHVRDSRGCPTGWPDLVMVRAGRLVAAELKTATGRVSPAQRRWLGDLAAVPGVEVYVWRPADWPRVQLVLAHDGRRLQTTHPTPDER